MDQIDLFDTPMLRYLRVKEKHLSEIQKLTHKDWTFGKNRAVTLNKLTLFANEVQAFHSHANLRRDVEKDILDIVFNGDLLPSMPLSFCENLVTELMKTSEENCPEAIVPLLEKYKKRNIIKYEFD